MTPEIPQYLITSAIAMAVGFLVSVWLMAHVAAEERKTSLIIAGVLSAWFGIVVILGKNNFFAATPLIVPNIIFMFLFLFIALRKVYYAPIIETLADAIPPPWIISVHIWRIGGIGFITLYELGILPKEFAFPSGIGDLAVGLAAPAVAYIYSRRTSYSHTLAIAWNYIGAADLLLALCLGIAAFPEPFRPLLPSQLLPTDIPTGAFSLFPLILVPGFAVPLSLLLHALSLRTLKKIKGRVINQAT